MATHPPSAEGVVLVDFDGTMAPWGNLFSVDEFLPGAVAAVRALKAAGYTIGIFTSRLSPSWHRAEGRDPEEGILEQTAYLEGLLLLANIPFDFITAEKVPALAYFDDKAMRVNERRPLMVAVTDWMTFGDDAI